MDCPREKVNELFELSVIEYISFDKVGDDFEKKTEQKKIKWWVFKPLELKNLTNNNRYF